ncbi:MAG TPA: hypothetical protein PLU72_16465 [Candidatus Ozemobacteraceae bacterium]|nr:hypothetical protein [Candidatus Ozemobacteraceae bacterium]
MTRTLPPAGFRSFVVSVPSRPGNRPWLVNVNSLAHAREMSLSTSQEEYIA